MTIAQIIAAQPNGQQTLDSLDRVRKNAIPAPIRFVPHDLFPAAHPSNARVVGNRFAARTIQCNAGRPRNPHSRSAK